MRQNISILFVVAWISLLLSAAIWAIYKLPQPIKDETSNVGFKFSEERALSDLRSLTSVGPHAEGTAEAYLAIDVITARLQQIKKTSKIPFEIKIERGGGFENIFNRSIVVFDNVTNIIARIRVPSSNSKAILISSHWDSGIGSPGASDDGISVVTLLEILNTLVHNKTWIQELKSDVIFMWNGGEELGLLGASMFVRTDEWAKDIVAFVNGESSGAGGQETLFQAGNRFMLEAYQKSAVYPKSNVLAQDLFQNGLIIGGTDYCVYANLTRAGLDFAFSDNGYVYHTPRDAMEFIEPGTLQHIGENFLSLTKYLTTNTLENFNTTDSAVYFDYLSLFMFSIPKETAVMYGWTYIVIVLSTNLFLSLTSGNFFTPLWQLLHLFVIIIGLVLAGACSVLTAFVLYKLSPASSYLWYSYPEWAMLLFLPPALFGLYLPQWVLRSLLIKKNKSLSDAASYANQALVGLYLLVLGVGIHFEFGSSIKIFILSLFVIFSMWLEDSISLFFRPFPAWFMSNLILSPILLLFVALETIIVVAYCAMMGKVYKDVTHLIISGLVGIMTTFLFYPIFLNFQRFFRLKHLVLGFLTLTLLFSSASFFVFPFTADAPQRSTLEHRWTFNNDKAHSQIIFKPQGPGFGSQGANLYFSEMAKKFNYDANFRNYPVQSIVYVGQGGWVMESESSFNFAPIEYSLRKISKIESEIVFKFPSDAVMVNIALGNPTFVDLKDLEWRLDDHAEWYRADMLSSFEGRYVIAFYVAGITGKEHKVTIKTTQNLSIDLVTSYVQLSEELKSVLAVLPKWTIPSPFMQSVRSVEILHNK